MTQENNTAEATPEVAQAIPEPTVEELKARLTQVEKDLKGAKDEAKAHQKFGQEKQAELKSQSDLRNEIIGIRQAVIDQNAIIELQAAAIALGREGSEEEIAKVNQLLHSKIQEQETNRKLAETRRQQETDAVARQEYNQKADAIYAQAKTLFEGEDLTDIFDLLKTGNLIVAKREVTRAMKGKPPVTKEETPKETEEEKVNRLVSEKLDKMFPGRFASDAGIPGGGVSGEGIPTDIVAFREWVSKLPQEEYEKKYASKVNQMMREGKIK